MTGTSGGYHRGMGSVFANFAVFGRFGKNAADVEI